MSGLPERWQRSDTNSPFSQMTVHDGNHLIVIPIVSWTCRGSAVRRLHAIPQLLASMTDPLANVTQFGYNALGWKTSRTDALDWRRWCRSVGRLAWKRRIGRR